jgi:cytochrome bd-type quinol oxidase subunit 2
MSTNTPQQRLIKAYESNEARDAVGGLFVVSMAILSIVGVAFSLKNNTNCTKDDKKDKYDAVLKFSITLGVMLMLYGILTFLKKEKWANMLLLLSVGSLGVATSSMGLFNKKSDCDLKNKKTLQTVFALNIILLIIALGYIINKSGKIDKLKNSIKQSALITSAKATMSQLQANQAAGAAAKA